MKNNNTMQEENTKTKGGFLSRIGTRLSNLTNHVNILDKDTLSKIVSNAKTSSIESMIHDLQYNINSSIRSHAHAQAGNLTEFEKSNLIVSLSDNENEYAEDIFAPFLDKGYKVFPMNTYDNFREYNVYLISWK